MMVSVEKISIPNNKIHGNTKIQTYLNSSIPFSVQRLTKVLVLHSFFQNLNGRCQYVAILSSYDMCYHKTT